MSMGRNACHSTSAVSRNWSGLPAVMPPEAAPATGNHRSEIAKTQRRIIPSQKNGIVHRTIETDTDAVSNLLPGRLPIQTPSRIPTMAVTTVETPTKKSVHGSDCAMTEKTGVG